MPVRTVVTGADHPILRARAANVTTFGNDVQKLIQDLHDTVTIVKGAGLAAPQLGVSLAVCVARIGDSFTTLVNPKILWRSEEIILGEEGCLSLPDVWLFVPRAKEIILRYGDERGREEERKLTNFDARVVQHEADHLLGKLIVDYRAGHILKPEEIL